MGTAVNHCSSAVYTALSVMDAAEWRKGEEARGAGPCCFSSFALTLSPPCAPRKACWPSSAAAVLDLMHLPSSRARAMLLPAD